MWYTRCPLCKGSSDRRLSLYGDCLTDRDPKVKRWLRYHAAQSPMGKVCDVCLAQIGMALFNKKQQ